MVEAWLKSFDGGVAVLSRPDEPLCRHPLWDVLKHVSVLQAAAEEELHIVLTPDLQQSLGLPIGPGHLSAGLCDSVTDWALAFKKQQWDTHMEGMSGRD